MKIGAHNNMGDEKTASTLTIVERGSEDGSGTAAKWATKRTAQVAVVTSVVLLLVIVASITGFVVMSKQHAKEQRRIVESMVKISDSEEMSDRKEYITNEEEDIEIDTLTGANGKAQVMIYDESRRLQIRQDDDMCIVSTLIEFPESGERDDKDMQPMVMVVDKKPVRSDAFLSPSTRAMCKNRDVYWAHASCMASNDDSSGNRKRRQAGECISRTDGAGGLQNGDGFALSSPCSNCCAWCREGIFLSNGGFQTSGIFGLDANGGFQIRPGNLFRGNSFYCLWFFINRNGAPVFTCQSGLTVGGIPISPPGGLTLQTCTLSKK